MNKEMTLEYLISNYKKFEFEILQIRAMHRLAVLSTKDFKENAEYMDHPDYKKVCAELDESLARITSEFEERYSQYLKMKQAYDAYMNSACEVYTPLIGGLDESV